MSGIQLDSVRVVYPNKDGDRVALDRVSISFGHECVALLGPNGAGKSTMMGVVAGTVDVESGTVETDSSQQLFGKSLGKSLGESLGMVFQTPALDELLTVRENLSLAGSLYGFDRKEAASSIDSVLTSLHLSDRVDQQIRKLSGGLKRRVDIARALLPKPSVLLLDEPTTGLDVEARASLWSSIESIREVTPMTVLYTTHLTEEARKADRVVMLCEGKIVMDDSPDNLISQLGSSILRIVTADQASAQAVGQWCDSIHKEFVVHGTEILVANADTRTAGDCPHTTVSVTIAAPTLEDVYLWNTRSQLGAGALT
ncbi:MAG: ABC transporter ATP-binding protein [Phycisphaerales bacterium]